jgi:hypothetical protein
VCQGKQPHRCPLDPGERPLTREWLHLWRAGGRQKVFLANG